MYIIFFAPIKFYKQWSSFDIKVYIKVKKLFPVVYCNGWQGCSWFETWKGWANLSKFKFHACKNCQKYHYGYRSPMKFVQCLHNSTEAFRVWFKVVSNDFSEELTYKKKQYPRDMPNCMLFLAVSLKHTNLHSRWLCYPKKQFFTVAVEVKNDSVKERRSIVFAAVNEIPKKKNFAEYCSWASGWAFAKSLLTTI